MIFNYAFYKQEQPNEQIFKSPIYPRHPGHDWRHYFSAIFPNLYGKSLGVWHFSWLAEGDWYLECGSSDHSSCRESQVRLVLSESCTDSFDYWRPWNWDQSFP